MQKVFTKFITFLIIVFGLGFITCINFADNSSIFAYEKQSKYHKDLLILYQTAMRHNRKLNVGKSQQKLALEIIENYLQCQLLLYKVYETTQLIKHYEDLIVINSKESIHLNDNKRKKAVLLLHKKTLTDALTNKIKSIENLTFEHFSEKELHRFDLELLIKNTEDNSLFLHDDKHLKKEIQNIYKHVREYKSYLQKLQKLQNTTPNTNFGANVELNKLRLNVIESYTDYFISKSTILFKDYRLNYEQIYNINKYLIEQ